MSVSNKTYKKVRSLTRGLNILAALSSTSKATVKELANITGMPRATVQRLLETLRDEAFVRPSESDNTFRLALKVRTLSEGYNDDAWITEIVSPVLMKLQNDIPWPIDLFTLDEDCMQIRESSHRYSPLSIHPNMVGRRFPLMETASGQVMMAFCSETDRKELLSILTASPYEANKVLQSHKSLEFIIQATRKQGYGVSIKKEHRVTEISLPIKVKRIIKGCLSLIFFSNTYSPKEAAEKYLPTLRSAIQTIEKKISGASIV